MVWNRIRAAWAPSAAHDLSGVPTGRDVEYPHYAFHADAENFLKMIEWLKSHGVVTPGPWTRDGKKGLMYFRDPSGNLLEIYCSGDFPAASTFPMSKNAIKAR